MSTSEGLARLREAIHELQAIDGGTGGDMPPEALAACMRLVRYVLLWEEAWTILQESEDDSEAEHAALARMHEADLAQTEALRVLMRELSASRTLRLAGRARRIASTLRNREEGEDGPD